jgi:flagellar protein FlbD
MIVITRLNGPQLAINADLIERVEATPDTIVTLVDGTKYVVVESVTEIIDLIRVFRASILLTAKHLENTETSHSSGPVLRALPTRTSHEE